MNKTELDARFADVSKSLMSYCTARTSNQYDAEDLAQDIFLELLRAAPNLRDDNAFYGFMWSVAHRVYCRWYKNKQRCREYALGDDILNSGVDQSDTGCGNSTALFAFDIIEPSLDGSDTIDDDIYLLRRELALLSQQFRRASILYYSDGRSCAEIAGELSVSESMVKYLLFRSRQIIKEGMIMERKLGELSYNPKKLLPRYSGEGPNYFYSYMNNLIRQNIILACFNDQLTPSEISLEVGIPLPYLDDEISGLCARKLLCKNGSRYSANIVVVDRDCLAEIADKSSRYYEEIADKITAFVDGYLNEYRAVIDTRFSENTLRWQLAALLLRQIRGCAFGEIGEPQVTGWGERADIWLEEDAGELNSSCFNYCTLYSRDNDTLSFFDYLPAPRGDHHDFYQRQQYVDIFCDIAKNKPKQFSDYDTNVIHELCQKGYITDNNGQYTAALPVYTAAQYGKIEAAVERYLYENLGQTLIIIDKIAAGVYTEHCPKPLAAAAKRISGHSKFIQAVAKPTKLLIERGYLNTDYADNEIPCAFVVIGK